MDQLIKPKLEKVTLTLPLDLINEISYLLSSKNKDLSKLSLLSQQYDIDSEKYWNLRVANTIFPHHDLEVIRSWKIENTWRCYSQLFSTEPGNTIYASGIQRDYKNVLNCSRICKAYHWDFMPIYYDENITSIQDQYFIKNGLLYELDKNFIPYVTPIKKIFTYVKPLSRLKRSYHELLSLTYDGDLVKINREKDHKFTFFMFLSELTIVDVAVLPDLYSHLMLVVTSDGLIYTVSTDATMIISDISKHEGIFGFHINEKIVTINIMTDIVSVRDNYLIGVVTFSGNYYMCDYDSHTKEVISTLISIPDQTIIYPIMFKDFSDDIYSPRQLLLTNKNQLYPPHKIKTVTPISSKSYPQIINQCSTGPTVSVLINIEGEVYTIGHSQSGCLGQGKFKSSKTIRQPILVNGIYSRSITSSFYKKMPIILSDFRSNILIKEKLDSLIEDEWLIIIHNLQLYENKNSYKQLGLSLMDIAKKAMSIMVENEEQLNKWLTLPSNKNLINIKREIYTYTNMNILKEKAKNLELNILNFNHIKKKDLIEILVHI